MQWRAEGGGAGRAWPGQLVGAKFKKKIRPMWQGGVLIRGGVPIQALAPGSWRPSIGTPLA